MPWACGVFSLLLGEQYLLGCEFLACCYSSLMVILGRDVILSRMCIRRTDITEAIQYSKTKLISQENEEKIDEIHSIKITPLHYYPSICII